MSATTVHKKSPSRSPEASKVAVDGAREGDTGVADGESREDGSGVVQGEEQGVDKKMADVVSENTEDDHRVVRGKGKGVRRDASQSPTRPKSKLNKESKSAEK